MKNTSWKLSDIRQNTARLLTALTAVLRRFFRWLPAGTKDFAFLIILGLFGLLAGQQLMLRQELNEIREAIDILAKKTGAQIYTARDLTVKTIGHVYVQIPADWTNIVPDHLSSPGVEKHFIASFGSGFAFPNAGEYAFVVGIEKQGVQTSLETFLRTSRVSSDTQGENTNYTKINDEMFSIRRENLGTEYFRKIDDTVLVIFVYDNGDRETDDFEQRVLNSVGVVQENTLFDYR